VAAARASHLPVQRRSGEAQERREPTGLGPAFSQALNAY
jgi:hypothetical protein